MGKLQGRSELAINASPSRVWEVLADSSRLPEWVPVVETMTEHSEHEQAGSVRRCEVAMGGRRGYMVERCLESIPERRLRHAVEDDSLGLSKMFRDYSFTLELEPRAENATLVTCETFYQPRGIVPRLMNAMLMRRRFATMRRDILGGLKEFVEGPPPTAAATPSAAKVLGRE